MAGDNDTTRLSGSPEKHSRTGNGYFTGSHHKAAHSSGPLSFLNPTTRHHVLRVDKRPATQDERRNGRREAGHGEAGNTGVYHVWRSRDNRKGRHAALITGPEVTAPPATNTLGEIWRGVVKLFTRYPVWDVSYDVATIFTFGSMVWCINGFFVWYPLAAPWTEFPGEVDIGGGVTACVGSTIFEIGSVLLMLEAINENRSDCFGWALEEALEGRGRRLRSSGEKHCVHHHQLRYAFQKSSGDGSVAATTTTVEEGRTPAGNDSDNTTTTHRGPSQRWRWWPTRHELASHYLRDIGFLACLAQMIGATIFWIAGFTGLPPILDALSVPAANGIYWLPQVVGGTGFIVSGLLFMIEVQDKWWKPAPRMLGWHVGFWNLVGAVGFTLCGALGFGSEWSEAVAYASALSTFVGSWAFLIGAVIQWYESLDKYPISIGKLPPGLSSSSSSRGDKT